MPNVKLYVDKAVDLRSGDRISEVLIPLREMLCAALSVDHAACQVAVVPVRGMDGQAPVNVEMAILPRPERTRDLLSELAGRMRVLIGSAADAQVAIRIAQLDPATYVALK